MFVGVQSLFPWELFAESLASLLGYENKQTKKITESLRANQRHLLTKRTERDVYLKRLEKKRLISKVKFAKKIHWLEKIYYRVIVFDSN